MTEDQFDELVGKIYDAAVDTDLWPAFLEGFAEAVSSTRGTSIVLTDFSAPGGGVAIRDKSLFRHIHHDPAWRLAYEQYFCSVNVLAVESLLPEGNAMTTQQVLTDSELVRTEFYNDFLKPQDCFYGIGGVVLKRNHAGALITSFRSRQDGPFGSAELQFYERLIPHLQRACSIHVKLAEVQSLHRASAEILTQLPVGVVLLDQTGRAVFLNQAAEKLALQADGFHLDAMGRCCAQSTGETQALRKLIAEATGSGTDRRRRVGGAMALGRRSSPHPLSVMVSPLSGETTPLLDHAPGAVLFVCDPDRTEDSCEEMLTRLFGLSPAEARLAAALVAGQSINAYAEERGISLNTVKTQAKQVLAKTGTRRQAELVKLVLRGTALLSTIGTND